MKIDISSFKHEKIETNKIPLFFVVKSQDQMERRNRMIENQKNKKIGRINQRPVATGLLVSAELYDGKINILWENEFREPRHIIPFHENYLLTEINRLLLVNKKGDILKSYSHPWFAFLHTVDVDLNRETALLSSSGYDMILEIDLNTGKETWRWEAWKNGFNPDDKGNYLASNETDYKQFQTENKKAIWIKPEEYGEQGIMTAFRTAHPNMAYYHPYKENKIIVASAHNGTLYEVDKKTGDKIELTDFLHHMSHGLKFIDSNWLITDTTKGICHFLNKDFEILKTFIFNNLQGKPKEIAQNEWIQQISPLTQSLFLALDANRGPILFDVQEQKYQFMDINSNWCLQDCIVK